MVILYPVDSAVRYTVHTIKGYTPGQLVFEWEMVILIKYISICKLIFHSKQALINYNNIQKNKN